MNPYAVQPRDRFYLTIRDINQSKRPKLAKILKCGSPVYAVSKIPPRLKDEGERIVVLQEGVTNSTIVTDTIYDGREIIQEIVLSKNTIENLAHVVLQHEIWSLKVKAETVKQPKKSGRPPKYLTKDVRRVSQLHHDGMSIRKIAKSLNMSPTTVQKLLGMAKIIDEAD